MNTEVMFSSASDEWETPPELFAELDKEFHFTLDVAASDTNHKCPAYFSVDGSNGLLVPWHNNTCWMNPPYGRAVGKWMAKAYLESAGGGATVVCLVPARTDTKWWHKYVIDTGAEVRLLKGRVKFISKEPRKQKVRCCPQCGFAKTPKIPSKSQGAPFPSAIVIYRPGNADALPTV